MLKAVNYTIAEISRSSEIVPIPCSGRYHHVKFREDPCQVWTMTRSTFDSEEHGAAIIHVLDLPQLYTKPSAASLIDTLHMLAVSPPPWGQRSERVKDSRPTVDPEGIPKYLTNIISSSLAWIKDEAMQEQIWELSSTRLSERSGRAGMSAITRTFVIPHEDRELTIDIHEPALTSDNLGFKTWAASYMLAKRLHTLDLQQNCIDGQPCVLELGSGTGLVGITAAQVLHTSVVLTDLPEIRANLQHNTDLNKAAINAEGGSVETAVLDWYNPRDLTLAEGTTMPTSFPLILAADGIYDDEHPALLARTIRVWLSPGPKSRVVVESPIRPGFRHQLDEFFSRMQNIGLEIVQQGEETGFDDWGSHTDDDGLQEVVCWWSVWKWK